MDERLTEIKEKQFFETGGDNFIKFDDVVWLIDTVEKLQIEIEHLKVIEQAYEAFKLAK